MTNFAMIVNKDSGVPDNSQYTLRMNGTTGKAMFRAEGAGLITASGNTILNANQLYHVVGTYDGNNTRFYLNGVEDATPASGSGNMTNNSANLEIGRRDDGYYFPGKIDDVRIYNRALSAADIQTIYNTTRDSTTFWTFGNETTQSAPAADSIIDSIIWFFED